MKYFVAETGNGSGYLGTVFELMGREGVVGTGVEGVAGGKGVGNISAELIVGLACHERSRRAADAKTGQDNIGGTEEVDGGAVGVHVVHVVEVAGCAASCSDDDVLEVGYLVENGTLELAERLFTAGCKELGDGLTIASLEVVVRIDEADAKVFGQGAAKGGLAAGHETD